MHPSGLLRVFCENLQISVGLQYTLLKTHRSDTLRFGNHRDIPQLLLLHVAVATNLMYVDILFSG
jgi:hypothetical protein